MSKKMRVMVLGLAAVTLAGALAPADPKGQDPNNRLTEEQLKLVRAANENLDRLYQIGEVSQLDSKIALWGRRQIEALRASGAGKETLVAAAEAYAKKMRDCAKDSEQLLARGNISRLDLLDARYHALEAEMWLNQEKAR